MAYNLWMYTFTKDGLEYMYDMLIFSFQLSEWPSFNDM